MDYEELKAVKKKTPEKALEVLKWMCSKCEKTRQDCVRSLYRWSVDKQKHGEILDALEEEKFIDEVRYTRLFVSEKHNVYKWGRAKIVSTLRLKGIDKEVIENECDKMLAESPDRDILVEQLFKKASKMEPINEPYKARMKLFQWGYSRGFNVDDVNYCLDKYFNEKR